MATIKKFEELEAWQIARKICTSLYVKFTGEAFSKDDALKNQLSASVGSIMDHIAEGFECDAKKEFIRHLLQAKSASARYRSQLYRALDRGYLSRLEFTSLHELGEACRNTIAGMIKYLESGDVEGLKQKEESGLFYLSDLIESYTVRKKGTVSGPATPGKNPQS